jgi:hypothetical protein
MAVVRRFFENFKLDVAEAVVRLLFLHQLRFASTSGINNFPTRSVEEHPLNYLIINTCRDLGIHDMNTVH